MERYKILVFGRVQEVGFRFHANGAAASLGLTGFAKNLYDGSVLIEVQGESELIAKFIGKLKKGNGFSKVENMKIKPMEVNPSEKSFKMVY